MIRKQIYIDDDLEVSLKMLSARTGRPEAEHVREALRKYVDDVRSGLTDEGDPFAAIEGMVDDPSLPSDIAEEHDRFLYGPAKKAQQESGSSR